MNASPVLLAIDQGTTSTRAILFSADGKILDMQQEPLALHTPHAGWVEQDPHELWEKTLFVCKNTLKNTHNVVSIGITNQRETTILWDKKTGAAVYNALVWQDRRTADFCTDLKARGFEETIAEKTGLLLDPYFSASKIAWILDNAEGARTRAEAGELLFGTVDTYVLWKLTGGRSHMTDATNASRTMLYNVRTQEWDTELLKLFNIPPCILPQVQDNVADFGHTDAALLGITIPIGGMAGDQQAALIGQGCLTQGTAKITYGTGAFALMNIGPVFKRSQNRLLTTIAYRLKGEVTYAIEGSVFIAGAAIQWLRDGLGVIENAAASDALARSISGTDGVYFVPAFTGLGAPHWRPEARGMICGLTRGTTKAHIVRAALEAQGYQTLDLMASMTEDGGFAPDVLRIDGGLVANGFMCQFLANMLQKPVEIPDVPEATAWGAAVLAGLSAGVFTDLEDSAQHWRAAKRYTPVMSAEERDRLYEGWKDAVGLLLR